MNAKQKALLARVKASPDDATVVSRMWRMKTGGLKSEGYGDENAMASMLEPKGRWEHTPGGYKREVCLRLVSEREIKTYFYDPAEKREYEIVNEYRVALLEGVS